MNQVELLLPVEVFQLGMARSTIEVADETARWNPEQCCNGDNGH
jgi:hypothetical protein